MCLYRVNNFPEAQLELERAQREVPANDPGRDEIDYWVGATLIARKQPLEGLAAIERLLARRPSRADALELAVQTYTDLGSNLWNQVAERNFDSAAGYEVHGHALEAEGKVEAALEAYHHSKALDPRSDRSRYRDRTDAARPRQAGGGQGRSRWGTEAGSRPIRWRATMQDSQRSNSAS